MSLEYDEHAHFDRAGEIAVDLIEQILERGGATGHTLYNINMPTVAMERAAEVRVVPMATVGWPSEFDRRVDPRAAGITGRRARRRFPKRAN